MRPYRSYHSKNLIVKQCAKNDADVDAIWVTVKKNTKIMILLCWYVFIEVYVLITKISDILVMVAIQYEIKSIIHYSLCSIFSFHNSSILQKKKIHHFQQKTTFFHFGEVSFRLIGTFSLKSVLIFKGCSSHRWINYNSIAI